MLNIAEVAFWSAAAVLGYSYVIYPGLMITVSRITRRVSDESEPKDLPFVSLIIPAHNEELVLRDKLNNALALDYPKDRLEIIVASDGSTDATVGIARGFEDCGVRVLAFAEPRGKASVISAAAAAADGQVLCFCDANVMFRPDALRQLVSRFNQENVGAVSGDVRLASSTSNFGVGERLYYLIERMVQSGESRVGSMIGVDGGMYIVRRELFEPIPEATILDDFVLSMQVIRKHARVVYQPEAIATETGTPLARQEFRRRVRVSAGAVQTLKLGHWPPLRRPVELWQYVSHKLLRWLGPVWLLVLLVSSVVLWRVSLPYQISFAGQVLIYAISLIAAFVTPLRQTLLGGVLFYFALSHVAMAVGFVKGLLNCQSVVWGRTERAAIAPTNNVVKSFGR